MTSKREKFYKRRIAELEAQLKQRDERIATLQKQVAELLKVNAELAEQVMKLTDKIAKLSKNSSNSSKPPSSDIVKPPIPTSFKRSEFFDKFMSPFCHHRCQIRLVVKISNIKFLPKNKYFLKNLLPFSD